MKLGILYERIRKDEKALIEEAKKRGHEIVLLNDNEIFFKLEKNEVDVDIVLERCISHSKAYYAMKILNEQGIPTINSSKCADICGSKFLVTENLKKNNIPTPKTIIAFTKDAALSAIEEMGYPIVLKPAIGTWGTLCAKINDREAAEAIIDHKEKLGSYHHSVYYIQEYVNKPGRDIRVFIVGDTVVSAIYRSSKHWMTSLENKTKITECEITDEIKKLALDAKDSVFGDIIAIDMLEKDGKILVNEINYTVEFSKFGLDISKEIIDHVEKKNEEVSS
ncbi:lysine biosynthesis protein LysX [archaeon]|jgi:[lysine-biosynthesis-protein LysW]---L-2-aminoadipate ligase|nr:lysine biosynthesis protein LysX [archaeon]MBT4352226.1 lysine biosynthesis protein LysX [archaeon]MBT4647349.1 lysine biosynthesis protein LysX [archaeon]MBT6821215.1 lysine biosynthesis protein LysX [archaeon]MBT7391267.1 lysine biosynthesis protein LysX [archaeon]